MRHPECPVCARLEPCLPKGAPRGDCRTCNDMWLQTIMLALTELNTRLDGVVAHLAVLTKEDNADGEE